jgi:predicted alpha/beta-hydrolase family hydrolase
LLHGAGGGPESGNLPLYAEAFATANWPCVRVDCTGIGVGVERRTQAAKNALEAAERALGGKVAAWVFAGHSNGARVAAELAHDKSLRTAACVYFSYPVHPPKKLDRDHWRDEPLTSVRTPSMFVRGERDTMASAEAFDDVFARLKAQPKVVLNIAKEGHGLQNAGAQAAAAAVQFVRGVLMPDDAGGGGSGGDGGGGGSGGGGGGGGDDAGDEAEKQTQEQQQKKKNGKKKSAPMTAQGNSQAKPKNHPEAKPRKRPLPGARKATQEKQKKPAATKRRRGSTTE